MAVKKEKPCPICGGKAHPDPHYPKDLGRKVALLRSYGEVSREYGEAVLEAIRRLQRKELQGN